MAAQLQAQRIASAEQDLPRRIPYTAMVSPHNLRCAGGAVLTCFKIGGVAHEAADDEDLQAWHDSLCGLLRNIAGGDVALWVHTIREPRTQYPPGVFDDDFAGRLNERYKASLTGTQMMVNTHYLTLLVRGEPKALKFLSRGKKKTAQSLFEKIDEDNERIDDLAATVMAGLARHGPRRLGSYEHNGVVFSEILEFLAYLVNGAWSRIALPKGRVSYSLPWSRLSFGHEQFECRRPERTQVGALLAVNEYLTETTEPGHLNVLLSMPFPFVLTQSFSLIAKTKAQAALAKQQRLLINAEDASKSQVEGISAALDDLAANRVAFGEHHLSLAVRAANTRELNDRIAIARSSLAETGFVVVREDVCLEAAFLAQLPGNWKERPRPAPISSRNFIGFSSFHNYPHGRMLGNQWGPAVTLLKTVSGTPFYFNFHVPPSSRKGVDERDVDDRVPGHTLLLGPTGSGKTVIQTFMLAQCEKYRPTVFTFDKDHGQEIFIRAMGGKYSSLKNGEPTGFNPCAMPDTAANRTHLEQLIKKCIDAELSPMQEREIAESVAGLYRLPWAQRRFSTLLQFYDPTDPSGVHARFRKWCQGGALGWVFDNEQDTIAFDGTRYYGYDTTEFLDNDEILTPAVMYLFHRMDQLIDGRRFILNMDEFWKMLADPYFEEKALDAVKTYRKRNAFALFGTQSPADVLRSRYSRQLIDQLVTQLYLPNPKATREDYLDGFKLTEREYQLIRHDMVEQNLRGFLFKQGANAAVCELNLHGFDDELAVLSGTAATVELAQRAIAHAGEEPEAWLPIFQQLRRART